MSNPQPDPPNPQGKGDILIVDDALPNLRVLSSILTVHGYEVRGAPNGPTALMMAGAEPPDLVLLDIVMAGMNGYEVCRQLKEEAKTRDIPVIFVSGLDEVVDKVRAFAVGGVDYITKPFQIEEVLARVETHLTLYKLQNELEQRVEERTAELAEANASLKAEIVHRKQAEEQLKILSSVVEQSANSIAVIDMAGAVEYANPTFLQLNQFSPDKVIGQNWRSFVSMHSTLREKYPEIRNTVVKRGMIWRGEVADRARNGAVRWREATLFPIKNVKSEITHIVYISTDITDRKQAEEALRESEERYRRMFQTASVSLWEEDISALKAALDNLTQQGVTDFRQYLDENPDFLQQAIQMITVLDVNDRSLQLFGAGSKDELLGSLAGTVAPEALPDFKEQLVAIAEQKTYFKKESSAQTLQGEKLNILLSVTIPPPTAKSSTMLVSLMDITERKQAEETLRHYAERLQILHEIDQSILAAQSPEAIAQAALRHIRQLTPCRRASVTLFDFETDEALVLAAHINGYTRLGTGKRISLDDFRSILNLQQGQDHFIEDILTLAKPSRSDERLLAEGVRSYINIPLISRGEMIGSFNLGANTPGVFSAEHVDIAREVANPLAVAIQQARLYEQVQHHSEELEQRVAERTAALEQQYRHQAALEERQRLARDLHDVVSQSLFSASVIAETLPRLWERDPEAVRRSLADLHRLTRGTLAEMRTLLLELRPAALAEADLGDLLRQLTEAIAGRTQVAVSLNVAGQHPLPAETKTTLFRIAQEALNNIAKHARAGQATVSLLNNQPEQAVLSISDDGRGFDPNRVPPGHLGVGIMRERAETIGATLQITSRPGHGTEIVVIWSRI